MISAVTDQDHATLERWAGMADADTCVVVDAHLGGYPSSSSASSRGPSPATDSCPPTDRTNWTAGTLFPQIVEEDRHGPSTRPAATGRVVVLANLSGFDGSPESLRNMQLEYGAEIGRAIVNFDGPIVFCVVSRYHGGAFVVFSGALNDNMEVHRRGGFVRLGHRWRAGGCGGVHRRGRTPARPPTRRCVTLESRLATARGRGRAELAATLESLRSTVRYEKLGEVAAEFDRVHSIRRAVEVGSVDAVIQANELRPRLVAALEGDLA